MLLFSSQVIEGLKQGSHALKKINEVLDIQEIEKMMEETREGIEKQKVLVFAIFHVMCYSL